MMTSGADFGQLAEDLSPEDLRSVLSVFVADVRRLVGNLTATATAEDVVGFQRVAHGLAGAAGAVGAGALEQASRAAMTHSDLRPADLRPTAARIGGLADATLADLASFIDGLDAAARRR